MVKKIIITLAMGFFPYIFLILSNISNNFITRQNMHNYLISSILLIFSYILYSILKRIQQNKIIDISYCVVFFSITYFLIWKHFIVVIIFITELIRLLTKTKIYKY
ncbi:hypothetical protein AS160_01985 [Marinitoga sp. 38H-ov]|jgi:Na+-transporting NADH:ubiquinone oxidoreductase subunit NqrB|nr:hypothetical protein AS160_01985 [Marinitoga sp. 38H-ov]MBM7560315.1 Na+-transporting NADH:ubiquinone oxidoreductase subunit NqrB [Marinitoga litoralis]